MKRIFTSRYFRFLFYVMLTLSSASLRAATHQSPFDAYLWTFTVSDQHDGAVLVKWTTMSERDNQYFSIERSSDGVHYKDIGKVLSKGNTSTGFSYQFIDSKPAVGRNFYRLRMVDVSVRHKYSDIKFVNISENKPHTLSVFPNPAANSVSLELNVMENEELKLEIYDASGNKVLGKTCIMKHQKTELSIESLQTGLYVIVAVTSIGIQHTSKLVVIK